MENLSEYISTREAVEIHQNKGLGDVDFQTIRNWIKKYGFGMKIGGQWRIQKKLYICFLEGKYEEDEKTGQISFRTD